MAHPRARHLKSIVIVVLLLLLAGRYFFGPGSKASEVKSPVVYGSAVYDPAHHELMFLGVRQSTNQTTEETWVLQGSRWVQLHPTDSPSPIRLPLLMPYPAKGQVVAAGGGYPPVLHPEGSPVPCGSGTWCTPIRVRSTGWYYDTWVWNGTDWRKLIANGAPGGVNAWSCVYIPTSGALIADAGTPHSMGALYSWNGSRWTPRSTTEFPTNSQPGGTLAFDPGIGKVIAYSGEKAGCIPDPCFSAVSDTLIGNGVDWQKFTGTEPTPVRGNLVSDPVDDGVLLLNELGQTWVFAGGRWREGATTGPDPAAPGFLYTDGSGVYWQPQPGVNLPRWSWNGHEWQRS
jgi:hypothetical protein